MKRRCGRRRKVGAPPILGRQEPLQTRDRGCGSTIVEKSSRNCCETVPFTIATFLKKDGAVIDTFWFRAMRASDAQATTNTSIMASARPPLPTKSPLTCAGLSRSPQLLVALPHPLGAAFSQPGGACARCLARDVLHETRILLVSNSPSAERQPACVQRMYDDNPFDAAFEHETDSLRCRLLTSSQGEIRHTN